jgi:hypothetical protein
MNKIRRLLVPTALTCALVMALAIAATAAAETRAGEAKFPENLAIPGKGDIVAASASYDVANGKVTAALTTREAPGEKPELSVAWVLGRPQAGVCNAGFSQGQLPLLPLMSISSAGVPAEPSPILETPPSWAGIGEDGKFDGLGLATRSVEGTTMTLVAKSDEELVNKPFSCATVIVQTATVLPPNPLVEEIKPAETLDEVSFLLNPLPEPPAAPKPSGPAPGALSFAASKPVKLKTGKWTKVKVKLANPGGTTVWPVAIKAKAGKGIVLKRNSVKLPALLGGQTWQATFQVKGTAKAKSKSTIGLTATATGASAAGSVVVTSAD